MKTSFNFEQYREGLADELKSKRRAGDNEGADELLKQAQGTAPYEISKELKNLSRQVESEGLKIEEMTIDRNSIPDAIKLYIDQQRLVTSHKLTEAREHNLRSMTESYRDIIGQTVDFVDKNIVAGNLKNPHKFNHVIFGSGTRGDNEAETLRDKTFGQVKFNPYDKVEGGLFFAAGNSHFYTPDKVLVIVDPQNPKSILQLDDITDSHNNRMQRRYLNDVGKIKPEVIDEVMKQAKENYDGGVVFHYKYGTKWVDIADWIVDLSNETAWKITDREEGGLPTKEDKVE